MAWDVPNDPPTLMTMLLQPEQNEQHNTKERKHDIILSMNGS